MKFKSIFIACFLYSVMSLSSVFMKYASLQSDIIYKMLFYFVSIFTLGIFAILWQKLLTKNDLSKVYIFKSTTIIWGMIFGFLFFKEHISMKMILGALITVIGVITILRNGANE